MSVEQQSEIIKAFEVWAPAGDGEALELRAGYYGDIASFRAASLAMRFAPGVGLPGTAWAQRGPVIFPDLADRSRFLRAEAATTARLRMGLAIPLLDGEQVRAVVTLLCGSGVLEIWVPDASGQRLELQAGAYGEAPAFGALSAGYTFARGEGLPGFVWAAEQPVAIQDLAMADEFLRRDAARAAGLKAGLGIPVFADGALRAVAVLLSPHPIPLAAAFQLWSPAANTVVLAPPAQAEIEALAVMQGGETQLAPAVALLKALWAVQTPTILRGFADPAAFLHAEMAAAAGRSQGNGEASVSRTPVQVTVVMLR